MNSCYIYRSGRMVRRRKAYVMKVYLLTGVLGILSVILITVIGVVYEKRRPPIEVPAEASETAFIEVVPILIQRLPTIEEYICRKWVTRCEEAIAVAKSENFYAKTDSWDCKRRGAVNSNGSEDLGIFQINSIHWKRFGGEKALEDCYTNIDAAFVIYQEREEVQKNLGRKVDGFEAWYAYVFKKHLAFMH